MTPHALDGSNEPRDLGDGYTLTAPGVRGTTVSIPVHPGARARGFGEDAFDAQLESAGLARVRVIELNVTGVDAPPAAGEGERGFLAPPATVTLTVPTEPHDGAVVLMEDEAGALTWHIPAAPADGARDFAGHPTHLTFALPIGATPTGARGFGSIGKKIVKVFRYPVEKVEEGVGRIAAGFIRRWEAKNRPYLYCAYDAASYRAPNHEPHALSPGDWTRLSEGRALLFVHGTFSSCDAFHDLPQPVMDELSARYGGRIFAVNHPTMAEDPGENAEAFLAEAARHLPEGRSLTLDIICHSRGGLVAREIAARGADRGVTVGRTVMVGVPNGGTPLADSAHLLRMIDRLTTLARVVPNRAAGVVIDALVVVVKCAARALLHEMRGLRAMNPTEQYLQALNAGTAPATAFYAIVSNYEPRAGTPLFSLTRAADAGADRVIFGSAENDLVVPTLGGHSPPAAGFPVPDDRRFVFATTAGVTHGDFFGQAETHARLRQWLEPTATRSFATARGAALSSADLDALRPHLINLAEGTFSRRGQLSTTEADVAALFDATLPQWLAAQPAGAPRRIVFWAHGGLINERDGVAIAAKHVEWWKANGVFPIYFVWETGLFDALGSLLATAGRTSRGVGGRGFTDFSDLVVEKACRAARGDLIWGAMKTNAERASAAGGGARAVARRLARLCAAHAGDGIELHAVGHSAGSIFHAHFLDAARREKVPGFRTLQLLAPAIRVDLFKERVVPLLDDYVERLTMFSMSDDYERADTCLGVYRKSLLYLIHKALERQDGEPILGLRVSAENDPDLRRLFWGTASRGPTAEAVWSVTREAASAVASASTTHGGFDDDAPTMNSVALRVLSPSAQPSAAALAALRPYVGDARARGWTLSEEVRLGVEMPDRAAQFAVPSAAPSRAVAASRGGAPAAGGVAGRRYALCVGIDAYAAPHTLNGCVGDTREWGRLLTDTLQFDEVRYLTNSQATRANILDGVRGLVGRARAGDTIVFQFSGHGTSLPDDDGDENDFLDEAFVPYDWEQAQFLVDDDLRDVLVELQPGVSLTCFIDCCHSGTITRVFGRTPAHQVPGMKARFLSLSDRRDVVDRYVAERQAARDDGRLRAFSDRTGLRWVNFSACDATEKAFEKDGNGDFTRIATGLIRTTGIGGLTNGEFQRRLVESFGAGRLQTPQLDCPAEAENVPLLQFAAGAAGLAAAAHGVAATAAASAAVAAVRLDNLSPEGVGALDRRAAADRRSEDAGLLAGDERRSGGDRRLQDALHAAALREIAYYIEENGRADAGAP